MLLANGIIYADDTSCYFTGKSFASHRSPKRVCIRLFSFASCLTNFCSTPVGTKGLSGGKLCFCRTSEGGYLAPPPSRIPPIFCRLCVDSPSVSVPPFSLFIPSVPTSTSVASFSSSPLRFFVCLFHYECSRTRSRTEKKGKKTGFLFELHQGITLFFRHYLFISFLWSRLGMTCPRQRSSRPTLIIFSHSASRRHNDAHVHTHARI